MPRKVVLKLEFKAESFGGLLKHRLLGLTPRDSDSAGLGGDPGICISDKIPDDVEAAGEKTTL